MQKAHISGYSEVVLVELERLTSLSVPVCDCIDVSKIPTKMAQAHCAIRYVPYTNICYVEIMKP